MNCTQCGAALPPNAKFCYACGAGVFAPGGAPPPPGAGVPPPPPPPGATSTRSGAPTIAPAGVESLKCPNCGAPIKPSFGDAVVTCDYCGSSVSLGGQGWRQINKHTLLLAKVTNRDEALVPVHRFLDAGFFHRKEFEESKIVEERLAFVPFWVVPVTATTNYQYQDVAVSVGSTVATVAAAELLGSALGGGGNRGGFLPIPIVTGPTVNPTRADSFSKTYEFPVIAVKGMSSYQPKNYSFSLDDRLVFDKKSIPGGAVVLNGDLTEDLAGNSARSLVTQLQAEEAHKRHHMVSNLSTSAEVSDAELLHVPIYSFQLDHKGARRTILVDAHAGLVMPTIQG